MRRIQVLLAAILFSLPLTSTAFAQADQWALALRAGPSFPTQSLGHLKVEDLDQSTEGAEDLHLKTGPMISGKVSYGLNNYFSLGLNVEWESRGIRHTSLCLDCEDSEIFEVRGRFNTVSIMPFAEFRPVRLGDLSPYLALALGVNLNWIGSTPSNLSRADADNSFAVKVGGGFDYFFTKNLALNTEVGWKLNQAHLRFAGTINDGGFPEDGSGKASFRASGVSMLFGLRYYLSK